ncbi:MAG: family 43 glycosylhydrolase [Bacteroidaceae bacterium]|nr:family 43 glycosylhydrolase [Bacteroidaceae bacterium]
MKKNLIALLLLLATTASAQHQYSNPVVDRSLPDPTVIRVGNYFYLYATEDIRNVPIYMSRDLVRWQYIGTCFTEATRPQMVPGGGIWAPDINQIGDKFVLYYSKSTWGGEWECGIGVATARTPRGPFTDVGKLFISNEIDVQNSIDPCYFEEDDGRKYLFWGSFRGIYAIELSDDGLSVKPGAEKVRVAGTYTEATMIIKRDGYYYLIGSAGSCCEGINSTYRLVVARSENLLGPYVDKAGQRALDNHFVQMLTKSKYVVGPGHCSEIVQDDAGQDWIFYHGFDASDPDAGRKLYMDRIQWVNGWPTIQSRIPSTTADAPLFGSAVDVDDLPEEAEGFSVKPRSVRDSFSIRSTSDYSTFRWKMLNLQGKVVKQGKGKREARVSVSDVPEGMYVVNVKSKKGQTSQKILRTP